MRYLVTLLFAAFACLISFSVVGQNVIFPNKPSRNAPDSILKVNHLKTLDFQNNTLDNKTSILVDTSSIELKKYAHERMNAESFNKKRGGAYQLPYPVLFVHGLTGDSETWGDFVQFLSPVVGDPVLLGYCLNNNSNFSNSYYLSDISDELLWDNIPAANSYYITFNCDPEGTCYYGGADFWESNQSGIYKQGKAIGNAVESILEATSKDKIILVGHSMGGLAIREYHQNSDHWFTNGSNVAKLITIGTPNWGSDLEPAGGWLNTFGTIFTGVESESEAVRDLRSRYDILDVFQHEGMFLWGGGIESQSVMLDDFLENWRNVDVNCNGQEGDYISTNQALNYRTLNGLIEYASLLDINDNVVSDDTHNYGFSPLGSNAWTTGGEDLCACIDAAFSGDFLCENWSIDSDYSSSSIDGGHGDLCKELREVLWTLDEPDCYQQAYEVFPNNVYVGFISPQATNHTFTEDWDDYKIYCQYPSEITVTVTYETLENDLNLFILDSNADGDCLYNELYNSQIGINSGEMIIIDQKFNVIGKLENKL